MLGLTGGASLGLLVLTAGQSVGGPLREIALLAPARPRPRQRAERLPDQQDRRVGRDLARADRRAWRLRVAGGARPLELSRAQLLALPQHTYELPIACVEGWSTTQAWSGVRLRDLAALAGVEAFDELTSSPCSGRQLPPRVAERRQAADRRSLLALRVNGADLSPDHGYPARIIVPALPGVHCTKWVTLPRVPARHAHEPARRCTVRARCTC